MRVPSDLPRPRRPRIGPRGRVSLVLAVIAFFILLTSLRGIAGFYTDLLWFDSLGYRGVFTGVLGAKASLTALFSIIFFAVLWVNLFIADRLAPRFRPAGPEEDVIERYHELIGHRTGLVRLVVSIVFALIAGAGVSGQWHSWILFTHAQDFHLHDAQFHKDVGFYVFRLPFLKFLVDWSFASTVIVLIVTGVAHYLNGGIRLQGAAQRVTPQVKAHLSVLLGLLALIKTAGYYLQRYNLTFSHRGTVDGATYTDVKAQLPAINLLMLISIAAVALLIVNIWRRGWVLPVLAVGLWAFVAVVVGGIIPAFIQRVTVEPSESSKEAPYISRNITATRAALNIVPKTNVSTQNFAANDKLDTNVLADNVATVKNIRLWDPSVALFTYKKLQEIRPFYAINDVDVDRYDVNGTNTQVLLSARNLNTAGVPQSSWEARHLTYTHGYGVVAAPSNTKDEDGRPTFSVKSIPPKTDVGDLEVTQPGVYVGEGLDGYVIVNSKRREIDYQKSSKTVLTQYQGRDGVGIGSYVRRAAFALRFGDINPLISSNIKAKSKILLVRDVRDRVKKLAPFLSFDADPYAVVVDGHIKWIIDGYTTTSHYPNAQRADHNSLTPGSGLDKNFNYVRNSVKAVVDAYDGTTTFYIVDNNDPIIRAYREAFPKLFTAKAKIPASLSAHFRYPEDLFRVQTNMWGRYHLDDADDFYNHLDEWNVAQDPGAQGIGETQTLDANNQPVGPLRESRIPPYYQLMRLPGDTEESFVLLRPFVPVSGNDTRKELTAFMVARSDPKDYGHLETFVMPRSSLPDGPALVAATMQQDPNVAELQTLLDQAGSHLIFGNLILVPINQSLLYVRPVYTEATSTSVPELKRVIVEFDGKVAVDNTLQEALTDLFGNAPPTGEVVNPTGEKPPPTNDDVATLLDKAATAFSDADKALRDGDLATYQKKIKEGQGYVEDARDKSKGSSSAGKTSESTTTTTTQPSDA